MKQFVIRSLTFALILYACLFVIKSSVPYSWGNRDIEQKIDKVLSDPVDYDCLFIGSSKTMRHIDPVLFDSITQLNSYNLGCGAMFYLETHYVLEKFLKKYPVGKKTSIYLQKTVPNNIADKNLHSVRSKYYLDFKRLRLGIAYFWKQENYRQVYYHLISYLENQLCVGELRAIKGYHWEEAKPLPEIVLEDQKGYYPVDQKLKLQNNKSLHQRRQDFKKSKRYRENRKVSERKKMVSIERLDPEQFRLNTSGKAVEFFKVTPIKLEVEYYFDKGHFNSRGAEIFTRKLGQVVNSMKR